MEPTFEFNNEGRVKRVYIDGVRGRRISNYGRSVFKFETDYILKIDDKKDHGFRRDRVYNQTPRELKVYKRLNELEAIFFPELFNSGKAEVEGKKLPWMITEYIPKSRRPLSDWQKDVLDNLIVKYGLYDVSFEDNDMYNCVLSTDGRPMIIDAAL